MRAALLWLAACSPSLHGAPDAPAGACDPDPCTEPNKTTCTETGGAATCSCDPGFVASGGACVRPAGAPTFDEVTQWVQAYKTAHPGNGGKD